MRKLRFKKGLKKRRFFENVTFEKNESRDIIVDWIFQLENSKNIRIERFMHLLRGMEEIICPIYIKGHIERKGEFKFIIVDDELTKFTLSMKNKNLNFILSRSNKDTEESWRIQATTPSKIKAYYKNTITDDGGKIETGILFKNKSITAIRSEGLEEAVFKFDAGKVESEKQMIDLMNQINVDNYNNIFDTFLKVRSLLKNPDAIISIQASINEERLAEIAIEEGVVVKYTETGCFDNREITQTERPNVPIEDFIRKIN